MSWPVAGTMMIEPTESESLEEINKFCNTLKKIKEEIDKILELPQGAAEIAPIPVLGPQSFTTG